MKAQSFLAACGWLLILLATHTAGSTPSRDKMTLSAMADINSDGKRDKILLTPRKKSGFGTAFRLSINGQTISGDLEDAGEEPLFYLTDIRRSDRYREIVVRAGVAPDGFTSNVYWYDGRKIRLVGKLGGLDAIFRGDGTVLETHWRGFWAATFKYKLNRDHKLVRMPQKYYPVNTKGTVSQRLRLRVGPGSAKTSAILLTGTKLTVIKSDLNGWYFVQARNGARGWIQAEETTSHISGLPHAG